MDYSEGAKLEKTSAGAFFEKDGHAYFIPAVDVSEVFYHGKCEGRTEGRAEGRTEAEAECALKHFVQQVDGTGTQELKFTCPFEPKTILIFSTNRVNLANNKGDKTIAFFLYDRTATSGLGGLGCFFNPNSAVYKETTPYGFGGMVNRYIRDEVTGEITITGVNMLSSPDYGDYTGVFSTGETYTVICEAE